MINKSKLILGSLTILLFTTLSAFASTRVYVAASGNDFNFCTQAAPCRTIAKALLFADDGGEVIVTESGDYDSFTIFRSVTVAAAPGVNAAVVSSGAAAVVIGPEVPVDSVTIRNLIFKNISSPGPSLAINDIGAANLFVEDCAFTDFSAGILTSGRRPGKLSVRSSTFRKNNSGIVINDLAVEGIFNVLIDNCKFEHNTTGVYLGAKSYASIRDSVMFDNSQFGIEITAVKNIRTEAVIDNCLLTGNNEGLALFGNGIPTARLTRTTITQNIVSGVHIGPGAIVYSLQNNTISGNLTDVVGNLTPLSVK